MASLQEQMAADAAVFLNTDEFAEWVTYNGIRIKALVDLGHNEDPGNTFTADGQAARGTAWIAAADVPAPAEGDEIIRELDPETLWRVARVLASAGGMHHLEIIARESAFTQ